MLPAGNVYFYFAKSRGQGQSLIPPIPMPGTLRCTPGCVCMRGCIDLLKNNCSFQNTLKVKVALRHTLKQKANEAERATVQHNKRIATSPREIDMVQLSSAGLQNLLERVPMCNITEDVGQTKVKQGRSRRSA